jgi:large subunit ribosomal protein L5
MARLKDEYNNRIKAELMKEGGFKNVMEVPTFKKIVVNVGAGEAITNMTALEEIAKIGAVKWSEAS